MDVYNLNGVLIQSNDFRAPWSSVLYDDGELVYIDSKVQGSIFVRLVFEVVYYDILNDEETERSKPKSIPSSYEEFATH